MLAGMDLTFAIVTDVHFGPQASFGGKVRKLTAHGPDLLREFVRSMNDVVRPNVVFNLGDDIEDESRAADLGAYRHCMEVLSALRAEVRHVAGNHDLIHLTEADLLAFWGREGKLYYSFDLEGFHFTILHTHETKDVAVRIDEEQLAWLAGDLDRTSLPTFVLMHHAASEQDVTSNRWFGRAPHLCKIKERRELRRILSASRKVLAVFNGHLHWNHFDLCEGIPYVTVQSLIENLEDDVPGRPAAAHAVVRVTDRRILVEVRGNDPARYQIQR
jgi:Icc protein